MMHLVALVASALGGGRVGCASSSMVPQALTIVLQGGGLFRLLHCWALAGIDQESPGESPSRVRRHHRPEPVRVRRGTGCKLLNVASLVLVYCWAVPLQMLVLKTPSDIFSLRSGFAHGRLRVHAALLLDRRPCVRGPDRVPSSTR